MNQIPERPSGAWSVIHVDGVADPTKHRVLCVDDDPSVLRALRLDLQPLGIQIATATSAKEALHVLEGAQFSAVISDLRMPGTDGIALLTRVRREHPSVVRILFSGRADFDSAVEAINSVGLFCFVAKPWDGETLRENVLRALEHHAISQENTRLTAALNKTCSNLGMFTVNLEKEVQERTTSMLLGMVNALDLRDTETHWHSRRVALLSHRLAVQLGISGADLLAIERGALLHDVGKIGVSDTILLKPGKLTEEEWATMRRHAEFGYRILEGVAFLGDARLLVWQHHERWDGGGYPARLKGEDICIGARIFAVIDTYDAITSDRPYRKAAPHSAACEEIEKMIGTQFDPAIVAAWKAIPEEEILHLREEAFKPTAGLD